MKRSISNSFIAAILASAVLIPVPVRASTPSGACSLGGQTEGPTDFSTHLRPSGALKAIMLFVDFPDAHSDGPTTPYEDLLKPSEAWYAQSSFGKMSLDIHAVAQWFRMPHDSTSYNWHRGLSYDTQRKYMVDAVGAANPTVDFTGYDLIYIVPTRTAEAISYSPAFVAGPYSDLTPDGNRIGYGATFGQDIWNDGWGYRVLNHETSHTFGLPDLYRFTDGSGVHDFVGNWELMGYVGGHAPDFFAWHKWKLGWLDAAQVACNNTAGEADFTLAPVESAGGTKMVVMRTSSTVVYVAENRQALAVDAGTCDTGIAIYKVDASKDTGYGPIQLVDAHPNDPATAECPHPLDDALFGFGAGEVDSFTTPDGSVTIQVTANTGDDYTVHVTRTTSFAPPPIVHDRTLLVTSLHYDGSTLTAKMRVYVEDGYAKCSHSVPILIQKKKAGRWRTVKTAKTTSTGTFTHRSTSGTYRGKLPKITFGSNPTNVCPTDASGEWPFF